MALGLAMSMSAAVVMASDGGGASETEVVVEAMAVVAVAMTLAVMGDSPDAPESSPPAMDGRGSAFFLARCREGLRVGGSR